MKTNQRTSPSLNLFVIGLLLMSIIAGLPVRQAAAEDAPLWQDLNISIPTSDLNDTYYSCIDPLQPGKLLVSNAGTGKPTYSYDLATGQRTQLSALAFYRCNQATGRLYAKASPEDVNGIMFSSADPAGKPVAHAPGYFAEDGSLWVYAAEKDAQGKIHFFASPDGGLTWQERNVTGLTGQVAYAQVASGDGRVVYALTQDAPGIGRRYTLYVSRDAGVNWEKRYEESYDTNNGIFTPSLSFGPSLARTAGTNYVVLEKSVGAGSNGSTTRLISDDMGKTFREAGVDGKSGSHQLFYSSNSLVRFSRSEFSYSLANSTDGGRTWQPLNFPFVPEKFDINVGVLSINLLQIRNAPDNLFVSYADGTKGDLWHSADGGKTWNKVSQNMPKLIFSPYTPTFALSLKDTKLFRLDLSAIDKTQTNGVATSNAPDGTYFESTRHNISGIFKKYWTEHGGLAQFGFAWTEPFRELNPADGKIYIVQYFERNRFEYHPELAGTQYEVLLGLLGNQQTDTYRANKHGAFNFFADAHYPGGSYFPQTGHNLRNSFKAYWEANGGLSLYGYPISEEFEEVNPDDGKTYVVQYFERNRFEYHPENKGTRYEVLLGLLGNSLLKGKGWL